MPTNTMNAADAVTGSLGKCFVTISGNRYLLMQLISVNAKMEKTKVEVPIMGQTGKGNKATGWKGTGSAKFHYGTSLFRELAARYAETGEDIYFDMLIENEDPTTKVGKQIALLTGCNFDSTTLAALDAESDFLTDEIDFTFEGWKLTTPFTELPGMRQ
nr:MAG TPA: tail tube protein [Caudoviricetes sp.]